MTGYGNNPVKCLRMLAILLFSASLVLVSGCAGRPQPVSSQRAAIFTKGKSTQIIRVESRERKYLLYIPTAYTGKTPLPLVFNFHGSGSNPEKQLVYSDFISLADEKGFIVVSPAGKFQSYGGNSWNTTMKQGEVNDVQMIKDIIVQLSMTLPVDLKRVYATGFSGGGRMTIRAACEISGVLAAVAPIAGIQFPEQCDTLRGMPVITFHGQKDLINHYKLSAGSRRYWTSSVEDSVSGWVKNNRCRRPLPSVQISEVVIKHTWEDCRDSAEVVFYSIADGGHTWPGSPVVNNAYWAGKTNTDIVASELIWEFFSRHALP